MSLLSDIELYTTTTFHTYIDSRDLIKARDEAQELLTEDDEKLAEIPEQAQGWLDAEGDPEVIAAEYELLTEDERRDLKGIIEGVDDIEREGAEDWYGCAIYVPEHAWIEYVEEYAADVYGFRDDGQWPYSHIDWNSAADSLAQDYRIVDIDGDNYYVR